jgi:UDP-N-acetyl-D-mannosaminuronate dehydrogenase
MNQSNSPIDFVIGLGETGGPLKEILEKTYPTISRDIEPVGITGNVGVLHICYPFQIGDFVGSTIKYIQEYKPELTIIHTTVVPGTVRKIHERVGGLIAYSPIRGKHTRMRQDLLAYTKFVAGMSTDACTQAGMHLKNVGFKVVQIDSCEALEAAKLVETTYFGLLIAWAQEIERFSTTLGVDYNDLMALTEEVNYLPPVIFQPGYIGGHCIIPNIHLLQKVCSSPFLDLIQNSNEQKKQEFLKLGKDLNERIAPKPKSFRVN